MTPLRYALCLALAMAGLSAAAQDAAWTTTTAFPPGTVLYTADDVGEVQVATGLFRVGDDGATAAVLPDYECALGCMVLAVRVEAEDGRLTPIDPTREPGSWLVVVTRAGSRVELNGALVARGKARLRVPPGDHELTYRFETGEVATQRHSVAVATEVTAHKLPSRNAPPVFAPGVAAAAAIPQDLLAGLLDGGEAAPDEPATGWRMPEPEPAPEPVPVAVAPRPAPRPAPTPEPPAPPVVEAEPIAEVTREVQSEDGTTCAVPVADLATEAEARIRRAAYAAARTCLVRLKAEGDDPIAAQARLSDLGLAIVAIEGEGVATRDYLGTLRTQAAAAVERRDAELLVDAVDRILDIVPADPSAVALLEELAHASSAGVEDVTLAFAFVPGTKATRVSSRLISDGVSELGFLLSTTEVTNAQFAAFLNQMQTVPRSFHVRRPRALDRSRGGEWSVQEGKEDLPVVDATWAGADAYARWMGGRLPTAGEWTWAFQAGESGAEAGEPNLRGTTPVGLVAASEGASDGLGLVHMLGNAWEWTDAETSPPSQVVVAGGSFRTARQTLLSQLTQVVDADDPGGHIGFRVARPIVSPPNR